MDLGVHYVTFDQPGGAQAIAPRLAETARVADQGGVAWFSVMDHWFQMESHGGPAAPMLEGYTTLGFLAALTERVRLSLLVTGTTYRHPGLLAKTVATLDVLSGGRAMLAIGAAWYEREHVGLGVPFPPLAERFERLEETIEVCRRMWSDDDTEWSGRHYRLAEPVCVPAPLQRPGPPVMIGGSGERKTLRLVARHADACNIFGESPEVVGRKLDVLRGHCEAEGRDYDAIDKTILAFVDPAADPDAFLTEMEQYAALGVTTASCMPVGDDPVAWTTTVVERVVPRLRDL